MIVILIKILKQLFINKLPYLSVDGVTFNSPRPGWSGENQRHPTLNLYLYDISENTAMRSSEWVVEREAEGKATKRQPPHYFNVTYLITAQAGDVTSANQILWDALMVLSNVAFQGELREATGAVEVRVLGVDEVPKPTALWSVLGQTLRPAIHYRVILPLDVTTPIETHVVLRDEDGQHIHTQAQEPVEAFHEVAGIVRNMHGQPLSKVKVRIEERAIEVETDKRGRYIFPNLAPGRYTFIVLIAEGETYEQKVRVPSKSYDLQLTEV